MTAALGPDEFPAFFRALNGVDPFPWQRRLLDRLAHGQPWPAVLDLPTGTGKTTVLEIALFHLALEAERGAERRAPVRIVLVVDRRLVVDDAFARAQRIERLLNSASEGTVEGRVAARLRRLAQGEAPVLARRLRGGLPREEDWARTPVQPTLLCSTVDQVGSRLLFRGYGVSDAMKPVQAGLLGSDCLILLDEAHLAEPFRQTLAAIDRYRKPPWCASAPAAPWATVLLTATPGREPSERFALEPDDWQHPVLAPRLTCRKPVRLHRVDGTASPRRLKEDRGKVEEERIEALVRAAERALAEARKAGIDSPAIAVVVNRIKRARELFAALGEVWGEGEVDRLLLIGPQRPLERDAIVDRLAPIRTGASRALTRPLLVVSTQGIEAGVDLDFDALVSELAPLDALVQRFGRLNRAGRDVGAIGAIVAHPQDLADKRDPIYGGALEAAWEALEKAAEIVKAERIVEFGVGDRRLPFPAEALAPKRDAPVLLPAHLDLLAQTAPIPAQDVPVALFLHGREAEPDTVNVVWRADLDTVLDDPDAATRLLALVPPRAGEAVELPVWAVRTWLGGPATKLAALADAPGRADEETTEPQRSNPRLLRWRGGGDGARRVEPDEIAPGDTIVVPARYGGLDAWGWAPESEVPVADVAARAAEPFHGYRYAARVAPGLVGDVDPAELAERIASVETAGWRELRDALASLPLPEALARELEQLDRARGGRVEYDVELYGRDAEDRPRGVIFWAPLGLEDLGSAAATSSEDDFEGSLTGRPVTLAAHAGDVANRAAAFARAAALPVSLVADLECAGRLHDLGKADPRFQAWLREDDPIGFDPDETTPLLAKSGRRPARPAAVTGLPPLWRHEALSVRLALASGRLTDAHDPALVLWLIGTHHGHGRPFFPHADRADATPRRIPAPGGSSVELAPGPGPQSLAFDWRGRDWASLFAELRNRYGPWELARLEAVLRLADHRASEAERHEDGR